MKKELIPIIAAYWGAECTICNDAIRYAAYRHRLNSDILFDLEYELPEGNGFKLHLRPLWSITEEELQELGVMIGIPNPSIFLDGIDEFWRTVPAKQLFNDINDPYLIVYEDGYFELGECKEYCKIINYLRSKGFCVDQVLFDAGLVEWKEVGL